MIQIEKYIADLIGNHDCVIVPGLGAFVAQVVSATIHPITHKFTAPNKTLSFNAQIQVNDGLLAAEISRKENISFNDALANINDYVKAFNAALSVLKHFNCVGVGRFFYNKGGKLEFEPDYTINFSSDSFGLPDFVFKPIDRNNTYEMNSPTNHRTAQDVSSTEVKEEGKKKKSSTATKILFVMMPLLVLIGAAGFVVYNQQNDLSLGGIHLFDSMSSKQELAVDTSNALILVDSLTEENHEEYQSGTSENFEESPEVVAVTPEIKTPVSSKKATIIKSSEVATGKYYIVVGSFKNENNADGLYSNLQNNSKSVVKLPLDANGFYKVGIGSFESLEAANAEFASVQNTYAGSWIKKY